MSEEKKKKNIAGIVLSVITIILIIYSGWLIDVYAGLVPAAGFAVIALGITGLIYLLGRKYRKTSYVLGIIYLALVLVISATGHTTDQKISKIQSEPEYELVQIVAMKDSGITEKDDFSNYKLAYSSLDKDGYKRASDILQEHEKKVYKAKPYDNIRHAYGRLKDDDVQLMLLTGLSRGELKERYPQYTEDVVVLFEKKYEMSGIEAKAVDIEKEPCVIYLQGSDLSSGDNINATGRGDCNILLAINPVTCKVNMQVIPRDTFVNIPCTLSATSFLYLLL